MRLNKLSFKKKLAATLVAAAVLVGLPVAAYAGFAPSSRPTYQCITPTNCPGADKVVFNSFTNAPNYGDERGFFDAKDSTVTTQGGYKDSVAVKDGQKLTARVYIHNNANPKAIGEAAATAKNTQLSVMLPKNKATSNKIAAQIMADNATPKNVSDTVDLVGENPFTVAFDTSAPVQITYRPNGTGEFVTNTLPGASFNGTSMLNANFGDWKGCFEYSAFVTVTVVVKMDTPVKVPGFTIEKGVRLAGSNGAYVQDVTTKYGDNVEYQVLVKNTGETELKNTLVKDVRPAGVDYTPGSLKVNGATSNGDLFGAGVTIPSIAIGGQATITYGAKVNKLDKVTCDLKNYRNVASAKPEGLTPKEDDANVKAECDVTVPPKYACDLLTATKTGNGREVKFVTSASASGGATIDQYVYSFGDGSADVSINKNEVTHTYTKDGKFDAKVKVLVKVGDQIKTAESEKCVTTIEFKKVDNPIYACDLLTAEKTGGRTVKFTAKASADGGATIKRFVFSFGDGSADITTDKNEYSYTYAKDGQYAARVKVQFAVGNETVTSESDKCTAVVSFTTPPVTPPTTPSPTTPGKLPETGAGSVVLTFVSVMTVSSVGYYFLARRGSRI